MPPRRPVPQVVLVLVHVLVLGCEEPAAELRAPRPAAPAPEEPTPAPAAPLPVPTARDGEDPAACAARLAAETPPEVHATLVDLGWVDFFADACGAAIAVRDHAPAGCDELSARALRERCRIRVAMTAGDVSACPSATAGAGHDPLCVALASGEVALCRGTTIVDRPACEALLSRDPERCARSAASAGRCRAETAELAALVPTAPAEPLTIAEPELELEVRRIVPSSAGDVVGEPTTLELASFERGAVLVREGGALHVHLGDDGARGASLSLELELPDDVPDEGGFEAELAIGTAATVALRLPDVGALSPGEGVVRLSSLEPRLGGHVVGRIEVELFAPVGSVRVAGRFETFVRDLSP